MKSATNISTTDIFLKVCKLLALVNLSPKQINKYMVPIETTEKGQALGLINPYYCQLCLYYKISFFHVKNGVLSFKTS